MSDLFDGAEVISVYTRAQAIADGVLVDMSETRAAEPFKFPVAFTAALVSDLRRGQGSDPETFEARAWDVSYMATRGRMDGSDAYFRVKVGRQTLSLRANCGPGDDAEPVITIGYPEDF